MGNILKKKAERLTEAPPSARYVVPNHLVSEDIEPHEHPNHGYCNNKIKTTKYTTWSFLPKNLFEQFHRYANIYFVFIILLNWVPMVNAIGKEIAWIPLVFVLGVTAIKDAFEDFRRYKSDKIINHLPCRVYSKSERRYVKKEWCDLRVGDIIHLSCNEIIPADVVLLRSSDESGICHVDTANIDGENNLKQRQIIRGLKQQGAEFHPTIFTHTIECELPSIEIYKFHGAMLTTLGEKIAISNNNLLLRGCIVRDTDFIEGIIVYAGHETKALMNNRGPRYKRSKLERRINTDVLYCVIILFLMCTCCACGSGMWLNQFNNSTEVIYIPYESLTEYSPVYQGLVRFWTFIILYQVLIPMSLYVTIELIKIGQVYLIHHDAQLYDPISDKRVECRALNITEDLGQVEYVFSDKTGTLTENKMVFKKCTVGGMDFSLHNATVEEETESGEQPDGFTYSTNTQTERYLPDPTLQRELASMSLTEARLDLSSQTQRIHDFFLILTVCNTVVVSAHEHLDLMDASGNLPAADSSLNSSFSERDQRTPRGSSARVGGAGDRRRHGSGLDTTHGDNKTDRSMHQVATSPDVMMQNDEEIRTPDEYSSLDRYSRLREGASVPTASSPLPPSQRLPTPHSAENFDRYTRLREASTPLTKNYSAPSPTRDSFNRRMRLKLPAFLSSLSASYNSYTVSSRSSADSFPDDSDTSVMSENTLKTRYEAESPDELALVRAACSYGCRLVRRTPEHVSVWLPGEGSTAIQVLHVLPFDAFRKRMSVIVRHPVTKDIVLYCKGADTNMFTCLKDDSDDVDHQRVRNLTTKHLTCYAKQGLRTLCMAKRVLSATEYELWAAKHDMVESALQNRDRLMYESACRIETNLTLIGATGIEDRLQERVPETIFALRKAGVKVWVLTGDKQETALNIAYSAQLFSFDQQLIVLNARNREVAESLVLSKLEFLDTLSETASTSTTRSDMTNAPPTPPSRGVAMVIDGKTLGYMLEEDLWSGFLELAGRCTSVLCVRATPFQKAAVVKLVRDKLGKLTLAIGDGANDVSMIQTADIGVGISGEEGMQAVMAADFSLARFRFLQRLLLVHGHWCYDRLARMALYMWYKNAVFIFMLMYFQFFSGFSGGTFLDDFNLIMFNLVYTSLPPIIFGVLEQDLPGEALMGRPTLYTKTKGVYRKYSYFIQIADALWQATVFFFIPYIMYYDSTVGIWEFGFTANAGCVWTTLLHLCIETKSWTLHYVSSHLLSLAVFYMINILLSVGCVACSHPSDPYWVALTTMGRPDHWAAVALIVVTALTPRFVVRGLHGTLYPGYVSSEQRARVLRRKQQQTPKPYEQYYATWSSSSSNSSNIRRHRKTGSEGPIII